MCRLVGVFDKRRKSNVVGRWPHQKTKTEFFSDRCEVNDDISGDQRDERKDNRHRHNLNDDGAGVLVAPETQEQVIRVGTCWCHHGRFSLRTVRRLGNAGEETGCRGPLVGPRRTQTTS